MNVEGLELRKDHKDVCIVDSIILTHSIQINGRLLTGDKHLKDQKNSIDITEHIYEKTSDIRNVSPDKTKKEIIAYLKNNKKAYPSDIADALRLDFDTVVKLVKELQKEGRIK